MLKTFFNKLRDLFLQRFYNRLMLINTLIYLAATCLFAAFATNFALQLERMEQLQQDRDALNALGDYYDSKHNEFTNLIFKLYDESSNYDAMSNLLESKNDNPFEYDAKVKQSYANMFRSVAFRDNDIEAVFIYKNLSGVLFEYDNRNRIMSSVGKGSTFFSGLCEKITGRKVFGTSSINIGNKRVNVYGIAGSFGTRNIQQGAGNLMIAYNVQSLNRILQAYYGKIQGRFLIVSTQGDVIFDSYNEYGNGPFPDMDALMSGKSSAVINGERCYIQIVARQNRHYLCAHILPEKAFMFNLTNYLLLVFGIFIVMVLLSMLLYYATGSLVSRRVGTLQKAMKRIGSNNLSYRIPLKGHQDEFEQIAAHFNEMCDKLQETINREYVSEIKKKNAELCALQEGINPHFLFNALEAIRVKANDEGVCDIAGMIVLLANLYRSIVRERTFIPILKEIDMCSMYVNLFSMRYASNFDCIMDIEQQVLDYGIPKNLLQPIIENYFVYGIRKNHDDNLLEIHGYKQGDDIYFTIEDNGNGITESRMEEISRRLIALDHDENSSYGLPNVHERIKLVYGEQYGLSLKSDGISGTQVTIRIKAVTCDELNKSIRKPEEYKE